MSDFVRLDLCEGNIGALTFMMEAYSYNMFFAERGFKRMQDNNITGSKLYILWNDCCNRDTEAAVMIMVDNTIEDIMEHINTGKGRGIPYELKEE